MLTTDEKRGSESLEAISMLTLEFGRLAMEAGSSARHVEEISTQVAVGLGAERVDLRVDYASLAVTIGVGSDGLTRMCRVGPLSVNETLHRALSDAAARIGQGGFTLTEARAELTHLRQNCPSHPDWFVAVAVGAACAAFGRLLGVDWAGVAPILIASALGQIVRRQLALHHVNVFISATAVAFLGSALCRLGARWAGSQTLATDIIAPMLLLVPGVPAFNAEYDILEGHPTIGASRAIWVVVMVVFMTVGVWLAQGLLGVRR
jgi:uncharacterized membrane protein YjjP (DUF1212 family)